MAETAPRQEAMTHGPSREGVSGERQPPDSGNWPHYASEQSAPDWRYFTQHSYADLAEGF